jgi:hypothetical protein
VYRCKICNRINLVCFLKFVVHEINSEMVKSEIVLMTGRENGYMTDANLAVG